MTIGITGNTGAGKTVMANYFSELGAAVISADRIGWELLGESTVIEEIVDCFGNDILTDGEIDRKKLGKKVFINQDELRKLNSIVHPPLLRRLKRNIEDTESEVIVVDAALIFEWGIEDWFDCLILVEADRDIIRERLVAENVSEDVISGRLNAQINSQSIEEDVDFVIENNDSKEELKEKTLDVWKKILNNV